ncbi:succinate dehydrogenase/fumarate reductase iron-sulfur subunit [Caldilinea sp.]|uniref:succinate dehydrogenase/fumarate reductase iron-sulfur subunit n=1 Tax=Caldilinea sp. TaxID=2293560 RepID=UPI002B956644|nr:succinate dehydrogenase/fumarate reductase iron-sulfur subunit [Anaerolineales bacterium]HQY92429.1 succinate dehydrogenase/fumarate reductase iron-sulfur subunit [Caldilinea sp.]
MRLKLRIWRQKNAGAEGKFVDYNLDGVSEDSSFLEMLDLLNGQLIDRNEEPVHFDHDCREGICGMCGMVINGIAHGPKAAITTCQLHMREFKDGDSITIEPWRAKPFPVMKDLIVDRTAFDRIIESGGYISVNTGQAPDASVIAVPKSQADRAMDAAACIGCGACVAACPNGSAMLFTSAKLAHLNSLPQGQTERFDRAVLMVNQMDAEGFGGCTNIGECEAVCPKEISLDFIAMMNLELLRGNLKGKGKR